MELFRSDTKDCSSGCACRLLSSLKAKILSARRTSSTISCAQCQECVIKSANVKLTMFFESPSVSTSILCVSWGWERFERLLLRCWLVCIDLLPCIVLSPISSYNCWNLAGKISFQPSCAVVRDYILCNYPSYSGQSLIRRC